jgi:signal peptidase
MSKSKRNPIPTIIGIAFCVLLLPFAAVSGTLAVKSYLHPEKVATVLGYGTLIVETGSMRPAFKENDLLVMKEGGAGALEAGDVLAYYTANGTVVSHRVIGHDADDHGARLYTTKGDANNVEDRDPVPASRVAGLIVHVIPDGGKAMRAFGQPPVTVLLVAVPLGLYFGAGALLRAVAARKSKKEVTAQANEPQA